MNKYIKVLLAAFIGKMDSYFCYRVCVCVFHGGVTVCARVLPLSIFMAHVKLFA